MKKILHKMRIFVLKILHGIPNESQIVYKYEQAERAETICAEERLRLCFIELYRRDQYVKELITKKMLPSIINCMKIEESIDPRLDEICVRGIIRIIPFSREKEEKKNGKF